MTSERSLVTVKADLADAVHEIMARYPKNRSAIMPALYFAQEKYGAVDDTVYQAVAEILDIPEIWVFEVASFYHMYNRKALGKYHVQLCTNISCMLLGAYDVLDHIENRLAIKVGATTPDGRFTLSCVECIGACDQAPVMMINDHYHNKLTNERLDVIIDNLSEKLREGVS